jgi:hypothetical protein
LIYAVREVEGIERFRVCQKRVDCFHVQLIRDARFPADGEDRIREAWKKLFRVSLEITFEYVDAFPVEHSGKFRHIVSELPAGRSLVAHGDQ